METIQRDDLMDMRLRQLERLTSAIVESQQNTAQVLTDYSRRFDSIEARLDKVEQRLDKVEQRLDRVEQRLDRVEELLTLVLDDLAFIKEILKPGE